MASCSEATRHSCSPRSTSSSVGWRKPRSGSILPSACSRRTATRSGSRGRTRPWISKASSRSSSFSEAARASRSRSRRSAARWPTGFAARAHRPMAASCEPSWPSTRTPSTRSSRPCGTSWRSSPSAWTSPSGCSRRTARASGSDRANERGQEDLMGELEVLIPIVALGGFFGSVIAFILSRTYLAKLKAEPSRWGNRAGRRARGGGRAAARSGGTRGASRFYGAVAGQGTGRRGGGTGPWREAYGVYVMQTPMPPMPPGLDPNLVFNEVVPIIAAVVVILVVAVALRGILRTPVGEAIAERIRTRVQRRGGAGGAGGDDPQRVAELEAQVSHLQGQVSELAERLDFAERMLAERRERKLGAGQ